MDSNSEPEMVLNSSPFMIHGMSRPVRAQPAVEEMFKDQLPKHGRKMKLWSLKKVAARVHQSKSHKHQQLGEEKVLSGTTNFGMDSDPVARKLDEVSREHEEAEPACNIDINANVPTLSKIFTWIKQRNKLPANFPAPLNKLITQLEFWKVCAMFMSFMSSLVTFYHLELISKAFMDTMIFCLLSATLLLLTAHTLQDICPEIAAGSLIIGLMLIVIMFHVIVFDILKLPIYLHVLAICFFSFSYFILLLIILYRLYKEGVRGHVDIVTNMV